MKDKVLENSALLKELWEGKRTVKDLQHTLQREREHAKSVQLEYDEFRHQVTIYFMVISRSSCDQSVSSAAYLYITMLHSLT